MEKIDLKEFISSTILSGKKKQEYSLEIEEQEEKYYISYKTFLYNKTGLVGRRTYDELMPKQILLDENTFEVLGLLQGEMSKTHREMLTFANSEPAIMNKVLDWFEAQGFVKRDEWNWYVRLNIPEETCKHTNVSVQEIAKKWVSTCNLNPERKYEKTVTFTPHTKNRVLQNQGTLIIERGNRIFVQIIQKLVRDVTASILQKSKTQIIAYMRGIIAAESCVNYELKSGHRRVFITATKEDERAIFRKCLHKIGIQTKDCKPIKDIVISGRDMMQKMHELNLMTLHPDKHKKFLEMLSTYTNWWHESRKSV